MYFIRTPPANVQMCTMGVQVTNMFFFLFHKKAAVIRRNQLGQPAETITCQHTEQLTEDNVCAQNSPQEQIPPAVTITTPTTTFQQTETTANDQPLPLFNPFTYSTPTDQSTTYNNHYQDSTINQPSALNRTYNTFQPIHSPAQYQQSFTFPDPLTPTAPSPHTPTFNRRPSDRQLDNIYQRLSTIENNQTEIQLNQQFIMTMLTTSGIQFQPRTTVTGITVSEPTTHFLHYLWISLITFAFLQQI